MGSAGAAWAFSGCLVVGLGLWRVYLRFFGFGVPWSVCGLFSPDALVFFGGLVDHFLWVCWGPMGSCVTVDALVVLLGAYRGAGVSACAAGLRLSWPFLDFLLGGFGKIQLTQIIQFAIYLHKFGNADAKCHEIRFPTKCSLFVNFFIVMCKYVFSKLDYFVNVVFVVQMHIWASHCNWKKKSKRNYKSFVGFSFQGRQKCTFHFPYFRSNNFDQEK